MTRIDRSGRVTIPVELREALDLRPGSTVDFERRGDALVLRERCDSRSGAALVERLRGRSRSGLSTDEPLALTRN